MKQWNRAALQGSQIYGSPLQGTGNICSLQQVCACSVAAVVFDPRDCSLPGSSVHGILRARVLECVTTPSCRGLPSPGSEHTSPALPAESLLLGHQGSPLIGILASYYFATMSLLVMLLPHGIFNFLTHRSSHITTIHTNISVSKVFAPPAVATLASCFATIAWFFLERQRNPYFFSWRN